MITYSNFYEKWIYNGSIQCDTYEEAVFMATVWEFVQRYQLAVGKLIDVMDELRNLGYEYGKRDMGTKITAEDLQAIGLTAQEVKDAAAMVAAIQALLDTNDNASKLYNVRRR